MEPIELVEYDKHKKQFNLAGIIPIAGYQNEYNTIWPDYLNPLAPGYFPFHKSVMECAFAGCDHIWIVCNHDFIPIIKKYIGNSVMDPSSYQKFYINRNKKKIKKLKVIPIMYVAIDSKYLNNCTIPFSTLYGAYMVKKTCFKLSKWLMPDRYFVSFMTQQYNINELYELRSQIKNHNPFFVSHNNQTVLDGVPSAFTFNNKDLYNILKWSKIKNNSSFFDIFSKIDKENSYIWEPKFCFDTKSWEGLRQFLGSSDTENYKVIKSLFTNFKFKQIYKEK